MRTLEAFGTNIERYSPEVSEWVDTWEKVVPPVASLYSPSCFFGQVVDTPPSAHEIHVLMLNIQANSFYGFRCECSKYLYWSVRYALLATSANAGGAQTLKRRKLASDERRAVGGSWVGNITITVPKRSQGITSSSPLVSQTHVLLATSSACARYIHRSLVRLTLSRMRWISRLRTGFRNSEKIDLLTSTLE